MSFFGSDGLEHQYRQLKAQLSSKDAEITSIRNELRKKDEHLTEIKRSREAASYKLEEEADRAHKAESALQQRTIELSSLRLQHDNLQASLRNANDKLKAGEKENRGLQYDNDSFGSSTAEATRLQDERDKLTTKVKELEVKLRRAEEEKENWSSTTSGMKRSTTDFFGSALSPLPTNKRSNRRRSTSLSSDNRVSELEAELQVLRSAAGPGQMELEKVKTQLANARKELDKVTNAKLALERSSQRDIEQIKSQLEDANFELEDWRRNDGSGGSAALDKIKKASAAEIEALTSKVQSLEREVAVKIEEIERLQQAVEIAQAKTTESLETPASATQIDELEEKIIVLESELRQAKASGASVNNDKSARVLQREIKSLQRTIDEQKEELAAQDEEISRLNRGFANAIPLPDSPVCKATSVTEDLEKMMELESRLKDAQDQLLTITKEKETAQAEIASLKAELSRTSSAREDAVTRLEGAQSALRSSEGRVIALDEEVALIRRQLEQQQEETAAARTTRQQAIDSINELQKELEEIRQQKSDLTSRLECQSHDDAQLEEVRQALSAKEEIATNLETQLVALRQEIGVLEDTAKTAVAEREEALLSSKGRQEEVSTLMDRLVESEDKLKDAITEKKGAIKSSKDKYRVEIDGLKLRLVEAQKTLEDAEARVEAMQEQFQEAFRAKLDLEASLNEAREEIANRSTESDARHRDEELFDQKEAVEKLQSTLDAERKESAKELASATFILTKDLEEAQKQVQSLTSGMEAAELGKRNLRLAEDKIMRLRAERDDLRTSFSFVTHEQRFTSQEAVKHRQALDAARATLDSQSQALAILEKEHAETGEVSARMESDLAEATSSRDALMDRVAELETKLQGSMEEHAVQAEQSGDLVSRLALAQSKASRAEAELAKSRKACKELEDRLDRVQARLDAKREMDVMAESFGSPISTRNNGEERPGSSLGHRRMRSGAASSIMDMIEELKVEKADLAGRISRRDARVNGLLVELKQAQANLRLAEEAAMENCEDKESLARDLIQAQCSLTGASAELDNINQSLAEKTAALAAQHQTSIDLQHQVEAAEHALASAQSDTRVQERSLQEVIIALAEAYKIAKREQQIQSRGVAALREADSTVERLHDGVTAAFLTAKDRIAGMSGEIEHLSSQLSDARVELESTKTRELSAQGELDTARSGLLETTSRLEQVEENNRKLQLSVDKAIQLEVELDTANSALRDRQGDVETLLEKLALAEKNRGAIEADASAYEAVCAELETAKAERSSLSNERDALIDSLAALESSIDEMETRHTVSFNASKEEHQAEMDQSAAVKAELHTQLDSATQKRVEVETKLAELVASLQDKETQIAAMESRQKDDQTAIADLQTRLQQLQTQESTTESIRTQLQAEQNTTAVLRATISELEESSSILSQAREDLQTTVEKLQDKIADLEISASLELAKSDDFGRKVEQLEQNLASTREDLVSVRRECGMSEAKVDQLSADLSIAKDALIAAAAEVSQAQTRSNDLQKDIAQLQVVNAALHTQLQDTKSASPSTSEDPTVLQDLHERVAELEATLTLKVQEVDDADDKVREVYKEKSKLEKKVAKLQRQLASATTTPETVANTAANRSIPVPVEMAPPSSIRSASVAFTPQSAVSAPSPRQPLRPVNVLEPKASPGGLKRAREEKLDEKPLPADCILLPPAQLTKTAPRTFRPIRRDHHPYPLTASQPTQPRINIFTENENMRSV